MSGTSDYAALRTYLAHPDLPAGTFGFDELRGFLFVVTSAPALIRASDWLPQIFAGHDPVYASMDEATRVTNDINALHNAIDGRSEQQLMPEGIEFRSPMLANFADDAPVHRWARGFITGHQWIEELWEQALPEDMGDEFASALMVLAFFASRELAEAFHAQAHAAGSLETFATKVRNLFPTAAIEYAQLGRAIAAGAPPSCEH